MCDDGHCMIIERMRQLRYVGSRGVKNLHLESCNALVENYFLTSMKKFECLYVLFEILIKRKHSTSLCVTYFLLPVTLK